MRRYVKQAAGQFFRREMDPLRTSPTGWVVIEREYSMVIESAQAGRPDDGLQSLQRITQFRQKHQAEAFVEVACLSWVKDGFEAIEYRDGNECDAGGGTLLAFFFNDKRHMEIE